MKLMYAAALAAILPGCAMAKGLPAGLYNANNLQEICLELNGTRYSPTFANWGGLWVVTGKDTHILGNYDSGAGNDSLVIKGKKGSWTEWTDDLTYSNPLDPISFTYLGTCTQEQSRPGLHKNPAEG